MGRYKQYTEEFKREVLAMVAGSQDSIAQIERDLGITPGLIYKWQRRYRCCLYIPMRSTSAPCS